MKKLALLVFILSSTAYSCKNNEKKESVLSSENKAVTEGTVPQKQINIIPISHATGILEYGNYVVYMDPVGGVDVFKGYKSPTHILVTDIHGDHLNVETLKGLDLSNTALIVPQAVADKLPENIAKTVVIINNGNTKIIDGISVEAIPMYNLPEDENSRHTKGRGNGYVVTLGDERIYISGDTEDIPEMRALNNIDKAFVCMNLPYTMTVESAADAVLEFKPKQVYPYHYRGSGGLSDVALFKSIVNSSNSEVKVIQLNWYQ